MPEDLKIVEQNPGTKTTLESIPEPVGQFGKDFVKYSLPGVLTKEELEAGAEKLGRLYDYAKQRDYRRVAGTSLQVLGHALMAAVGLAPFTGAMVKPARIQILESTSGNLGKEIPAVKVVSDHPNYSINELKNQGAKRLNRTLQDAEYRESLQKQFPHNWKTLLKSQQQEMSKAEIDLTRSSTPGTNATTRTQVAPLPTSDAYMCSYSEVINTIDDLLKASGSKLTPEEYLLQNGFTVKDLQILATYKPQILLSDATLQALSEQRAIDPNAIRNTLYHELVHASGQASKGINNAISKYNGTFPVKVNPGVSNAEYYGREAELRARAMSLRRLHQATGQSYEEILNNWGKGLYRPNTDVDDLVNYYDRESLLNYLNNFLKNGGRINYLDFFSIKK